MVEGIDHYLSGLETDWVSGCWTRNGTLKGEDSVTVSGCYVLMNTATEIAESDGIWNREILCNAPWHRR